MLIVRLTLCLLMTSTFVIHTTFWSSWNVYKYFTIWGFTLTTVYFLLVMASYLTRSCKPVSSDPSSPFHIWKWVSFLFQTLLSWEIVITVVFWVLVWP